MYKKEPTPTTKQSNTWMLLFAGGIGTAFFLLFTDIGRELLEGIGVLDAVKGLPTLEQMIGKNPYEFYSYSQGDDNLSKVPDYIQNPNPFFLTNQPYTYIGGPIPYVHPAAAKELYQPPPTYEPPNPITEWIDKLFRGENQ